MKVYIYKNILENGDDDLVCQMDFYENPLDYLYDEFIATIFLWLDQSEYKLDSKVKKSIYYLPITNHLIVFVERE